MSKRTKETKIIPIQLQHRSFEPVNALCFLSGKEMLNENCLAVFTHGYTTSKHSIVSWATRFADEGIDSLIFDLPGHYLGGLNQLKSFDDFKTNAHELFEVAYEHVIQERGAQVDKVIFGGHSLGALLALKASNLTKFDQTDLSLYLVGFGLNTEVKTHFFDTAFYQKTLNIRRQLVAPEIDSDLVFPWIKEEKMHLKAKGRKILLLTGQDDVVVGEDGARRLKQMLEPFNEVDLLEPKKLSHHLPEQAASPLFRYTKEKLL